MVRVACVDNESLSVDCSETEFRGIEAAFVPNLPRNGKNRNFENGAASVWAKEVRSVASDCSGLATRGKCQTTNQKGVLISDRDRAKDVEHVDDILRRSPLRPTSPRAGSPNSEMWRRRLQSGS